VSAAPRWALDAKELEEFHRGTRPVIERVYREHFKTVAGAVSKFVHGADQETVIHEVFLRLITDESLRRNFTGGSLAAWLGTVSRHHAIDYQRRRDRELPIEDAPVEIEGPDRFAQAAEARLLIERFRDEVLPAKWQRLFEVRFAQQLDQRQAAEALGISRTTLAYQEHRVRSLLHRFLRRGEP
jgi:RNA polymerase sigma-70 factor (ECF subfamily)